MIYTEYLTFTFIIQLLHKAPDRVIPMRNINLPDCKRLLTIDYLYSRHINLLIYIYIYIFIRFEY